MTFKVLKNVSVRQWCPTHGWLPWKQKIIWASYLVYFRKVLPLHGEEAVPRTTYYSFLPPHLGWRISANLAPNLSSASSPSEIPAVIIVLNQSQENIRRSGNSTIFYQEIILLCLKVSENFPPKILPFLTLFPSIFQNLPLLPPPLFLLVEFLAAAETHFVISLKLISFNKQAVPE